ncbi:conjugal transfer protein [Rhizobium leguminosarum]|nr:conjugal transfer protein [Rhizobium leguminosarum]
MGVISQLSNKIDDILVDYVQTVFEAVSGPITTLLNSLAIVALLFTALNQILQFRAVNYSVYLHWCLRYMLVYAYATIWGNFKGVYSLLMDVPGDYANLMLRGVALTTRTHDPDVMDPERISDTYTAMDEFAHAVFHYAYDFFSDTSWLHVGRSIRNVGEGLLFVIIGCFFTAASAIIVLVGKVGFAVSISLAPLAITMLMLPQTKQYFESWTRFCVGFVMIPLLTTSLMTVVLSTADSFRAKEDAFAFLSIMIAATVLLYMIPTMASNLAAASVAAVGAGAAVSVGSMVSRTWRSTCAGTERLIDGANVARTAMGAGASPAGAARSAISAMCQSGHIRRQRRDERLARGIIGAGP